MTLLSKLARLESAGPLTAPASVSGPAPASPFQALSERARVLDDLRSRIQATLARTACRPLAQRSAVDLSELPLTTEETAHGTLHLRTRRLSAAHRTGRTPLAPARAASPELLALLALDPVLARCDPGRALFLDTETTGLSGGAGTVAFLIGLAWWDGYALIVEQLLVVTLGEEAPVLHRVAERIRAASMLVTYNGKSFDLPLLRTRFVMSRVPAPAEPPHLDLLHVARRVHRERLGRRGSAGTDRGCRLVTIERDVLGFERSDDVESRDVSACYLHFLRTGEARALLGVIEHNAWDVESMAALVGLYGDPLASDLHALDLVGVARTLRRAGALDQALIAAEAAVGRGAAPASLRARADIAKARGDCARALADFEAVAAVVDDASVRLELAKLYEHWVKQPVRALEWVTKGTGENPESLRKRAARLVRKSESFPSQ